MEEGVVVLLCRGGWSCDHFSGRAMDGSDGFI